MHPVEHDSRELPYMSVGVFGFDTSDPEEQRFHYTNLQPMFRPENREGAKSLGKERGLC